jgi:TolB-like protein
MRARAVMTLLGLVPVLLAAQQRSQDTRPGIAVFPFNNGGSYGQGKEDFDALERGIAGMMISELAQNPAARVVERQEIQRLIDEQNLVGQNRVDPQTAAKVGKLVGARYVVAGTFIDFYGDFRVDVRLVNVETGEIIKTESERMQRDHMFDIIRNVAARLMKDVNLPALQRQASDQRMSRQVPTEALTYYSRGLLYEDRGDKQKAAQMFVQATTIFPDFAEAKDGLQRVQRS